MKILSAALTIFLFHFVISASVPPCASWTQADAVFTGKALKIESAPKDEGFPAGARKILFQVQQKFKGAENPTFAVVVKNFSEVPLKKGETWIVYAQTDIVGKSFTAFRRAKINPKEPNVELEILKEIIAGKTSSAIAGQIVSTDNAPVEIAVESGGKRLTAQSDETGAFSVAVPSDGVYKVEIKFPYRAAVKWNEFLLGASNSEGTPTIFRYEVRLNDGDCSFSLFEVLKKTQ